MFRARIQIGEYYHIYNRGVDKRKIFMNENDYRRFFRSMIIFNDKFTKSYRDYVKEKKPEVQLRVPGVELRVVEIVCYCLNPNHYHFLLKEVTDRGIEKFMRKIGTGYTNYFNKKYNRSGSLFQGRYKSNEVQDNAGLLWLSGYINGNPEMHGISKAENYQWSSYLEYLNKTGNQICNPRDILNQFKDIKEYQEFVNLVIQESKLNKEERKKDVFK